MSIGMPKVSNKEVHRICGELDFAQYENIINMYLLTENDLGSLPQP